ncbi:MAG: hypothetical protein IPO15_03055 [Anaerolineae bacterium]|uniref:hypothetical protein n=1 Tax=Candidatus Amarolinea dominans TaxID=3140696 RepID=UPI0031346DF2|nr:hypothetical protein [Anaerolineae bacterium]
MTMVVTAEAAAGPLALPPAPWQNRPLAAARASANPIPAAPLAAYLGDTPDDMLASVQRALGTLFRHRHQRHGRGPCSPTRWRSVAQLSLCARWTTCEPARG